MHPKKVFNSKNDELLKNIFPKIRKNTDRFFGKKISFYITSKFFPAISITGSFCSLNCLHCQHKLLNMMFHAEKPEKLLKICLKLKHENVKGFLISGGCLPDFTVPIEKYAKTIRKIKEETGLTILAHTGFLTLEKAKRLVDCGIDGVALDVVGSAETVKKVYGFKVNISKYLETLKAAEEAGFKNISPHVCVGLDFGQLKGEAKALKMISKIKPTMVVITVLTPIPGTFMQNVTVNPLDVAKVVAAARLVLPEVPVVLGCAKGKGLVKEKIEVLAFNAGVSGVAIPSKSIYKYARKKGYKVNFYGVCCAIPSNPQLKIGNPF
ncbi:MAG: radical SAM protein [Candidatus Bathyarchaeota archaeon]|nr:radical SAM protein [Candidatus Bathyarchaeota archaeon]